jgi:Mn-containing catalase
VDSQGSAWTASNLQKGGNVVRDLRADISAEAVARQTYEALIKRCDDEGTKKVLVHLQTCEITHAHMFMAALNQMGKLDDRMFGTVQPDDTVNVVFDLSQSDDHGGPWNQGTIYNGQQIQYVADPQPKAVCRRRRSNRTTRSR